MPKTPSEKLFRLVKSLSGSEKRYFKIFISNKGRKDNKYLQLFNAIEEQELFNDEFLQQTIYPKERLESRKYSEMKAYLYDLILKSLQAYDEKTSVDYKLKGMLLSVRTLYKRSLFDDCKELLYKAKKVANKYEKFNAGLEILGWEKQIAYAETDITYLDRELGRIEEEETVLVEQIQKLSEYRNTFFKILVAMRKDVVGSKKIVENLISPKENNQTISPEKEQTFKGEVFYLRGLSLYYFAIRKVEDFYLTSKKLLEFLESKKYMIAEDASEYISALSNFIIATGTLKKYDELELTLNKLKLIKPNTFDDELKIYRQYYSGKLRLYNNLGEFKKGYTELQQHLKTRKKFNENFFKKDTFYIIYFSLCFGSENYSEALNFLNEWLGKSRNVERKDLQSLARIFNLIIHYEMNNYELLESLLRSTYRFLNEKNYYSKLEKMLLSSFREAIEIQSRKELKLLWERTCAEYRLISKTEAQSITNWFPLEAWLIAQAEGKSFAKIVKALN